MAPTPRRSLRGFTLVEMMAVVVIVGILAIVGISVLRNHAFGAKVTEATAMIQSIRAAEERWRAETTTYLNVSTDLTSWYPMGNPGRTKYHWVQTGGANAAQWQLLNPTAPTPVQWGYAVVAGKPGAALPTLQLVNAPTWPSAPQYHWYVIQAKGDVDEDGVAAYCAASSLTGEVACENAGE